MTDKTSKVKAGDLVEMAVGDFKRVEIIDALGLVHLEGFRHALDPSTLEPFGPGYDGRWRYIG